MSHGLIEKKVEKVFLKSVSVAKKKSLLMKLYSCFKDMIVVLFQLRACFGHMLDSHKLCGEIGCR